MKEIAKQYDPSTVEERLYRQWMEKGYFHTEVDKSKKPFTIVMPPPNITGQLHMGHALDNMMQDAVIRFKRMQGYAALWVPGTDHASIATEVKIVDAIAKEGLKKEDLVRILVEPKNALTKQYQALLEMDGVSMEITDEALESIAQKALDREIGARGLRAIMEKIMTDIMFQIPSDLSIQKVVITPQCVEGAPAEIIRDASHPRAKLTGKQ